MNKVFVAGRLGKDPELKTVGNTNVCNITLASSESYLGKDGQWKKSTEWHNVVLWGPRGEAISKLINKGSYCLVEGKLKTRSWDQDGSKRYSTEIVATDIELSNEKKPEQSENQNAQTSHWQSSPQSSGRDDGMPF